MPEHIGSPDTTVTNTTITETGALSCSSGSKTGRVPKDKRIVLDDETKDVSCCIIRFRQFTGVKLIYP
jgi:ATP-dependent phosphoenolpyruvate carboxykinase